jgi:hypothetical protein
MAKIIAQIIIVAVYVYQLVKISSVRSATQLILIIILCVMQVFNKYKSYLIDKQIDKENCDRNYNKNNRKNRFRAGFRFQNIDLLIII